MPNISENYRTIHGTGVIRLVIDGKVERSCTFCSVKKRNEKMNEWTKEVQRISLFCAEAYIELIPNWDAWNERDLDKPPVKNKKQKLHSSIQLGGSTGSRKKIIQPEYSN